ncbi:hypothetical protein HDU84_005658, partial [Entophlyctis sp. JEL0112]
LENIETCNTLAGLVLRMVASVRSIDTRRFNWSPALFSSLPVLSSSQATARSYSVQIINGRTSVSNLFKTQVNVTDPIDNGWVIDESIDLIYYLASSANFLANAFFSDLVYVARINYVLEYCPNVAMQLINASATMLRDAYDVNIGGQTATVLVSTITAPAFGFVLFLALLPIYWKMESTRKEFLVRQSIFVSLSKLTGVFEGMFYDIPKNVVKGIYQARLQRIMDSVDQSDSDAEDLELLGINALRSAESLAEAQHAEQQAKKKARKKEVASILQRFRKYMVGSHMLGFKCLLVVVVTSVFFVVSAFMVLSFTNNNLSTAKNLYWAGQRFVLMRQVTFWTREELYQIISSWRNDTGMFFPSSTQNVNEMLNQLEWTEYGFLYGDPVMQLSPLTSQSFASDSVSLEFYDGCTNVAGAATDCTTFLNGVMTMGLHSALASYVAKAEAIFAMLADARRNSPTLNLTYLQSLDTLIQDLRILDYNYISPALLESMSLISGPVSGAKDSFLAFHLPFTICFVVVCVLYYLSVIRKLLGKIREDVQRTQGLVYSSVTAV